MLSETLCVILSTVARCMEVGTTADPDWAALAGRVYAIRGGAPLPILHGCHSGGRCCKCEFCTEACIIPDRGVSAGSAQIRAQFSWSGFRKFLQ